MTEAKALKQMQKGSEEALAWLIDRYAPYVGAVIRHVFGTAMSEADVEETAADVFFVLWENARKVSPVSIRPYLGSVARNKAKQKLRSAGRELSLDEDRIVLAENGPEQEWERKERDAAVRKAVLGMSQPDREIFLRYYYHCQPIAEISEEMGMPISTVKSRLHRGREKLRSALTAEETKTGGMKHGIQDL